MAIVRFYRVVLFFLFFSSVVSCSSYEAYNVSPCNNFELSGYKTFSLNEGESGNYHKSLYKFLEVIDSRCLHDFVHVQSTSSINKKSLVIERYFSVSSSTAERGCSVDRSDGMILYSGFLNYTEFKNMESIFHEFIYSKYLMEEIVPKYGLEKLKILSVKAISSNSFIMRAISIGKVVNLNLTYSDSKLFVNNVSFDDDFDLDQ